MPQIIRDVIMKNTNILEIGVELLVLHRFANYIINQSTIQSYENQETCIYGTRRSVADFRHNLGCRR